MRLLPALALVPALTLLAACGAQQTTTASSTSTTTTTSAPSQSTTSTLVASAGTASSSATPVTAPSASASAVHGTHFGYEGELGPEHWGALDAGWAACSTGRQQSPVDLAGAKSQKLVDPVLTYPKAAVELSDTGHALLGAVKPGASLTLDGKPWQLLQFHFHTPSEHVVKGKPADGELHLVHKDATGKLLVLGVLVEQTAKDNPGYSWLSDELPTDEGQKLAPRELDLRALVPASLDHRRYIGSLTTPPCTEGVSWVVLDDTLKLSSAQLARLRAVEDGNARPVQPLNGRTVQDDVPA